MNYKRKEGKMEYLTVMDKLDELEREYENDNRLTVLVEATRWLLLRTEDINLDDIEEYVSILRDM